MDNIVAILDRSGSMSGYEKTTIDGYNEFIGKQLAISDDAVVSLILFDDQYEEVYINTSISDVQDLDSLTYYVRGMTALRDALGKAIAVAEEFEKNNDVDKTIFAIFTDGHENASTEFSPDFIKTRIKSLEDDNEWEFIYVGCDHDVFAAAQTLGMKTANTIAFNKGDMRTMYDSNNASGFTATVASLRTSK
jgi:uncharacterized protein with von Willebrand factor type A (vWA) domain